MREVPDAVKVKPVTLFDDPNILSSAVAKSDEVIVTPVIVSDTPNYNKIVESIEDVQVPPTIIAPLYDITK